jgi:tellurite resistance protein
MQITYDIIAPLIQNVQAQGRTVNVLFVCPVSQAQVQARHNVPINNSMGSRIQKNAQRSFMYAAQNAIAQTIRSVFGYNVFGRMASDVARQTMYSASSNQNRNLSAGEQQEAVIQAFQTVSARFAWDPKRNSFVSATALKDALSLFDLQLQQAPIQHSYDRMVLARMLVQMAMADGHLAPEEEQWLIEFLDPSLGSIESLRTRPPLSAPEFSQVSSGPSRESMLMVVWTLAIADEDFAAQEQQLLQNFAQQLGLSSDSIQKIRNAAQYYILSQALESMFGWGGHDQYARQKLFELASKIGISQQEALMAEARFQRRRGQ